MLHFLVTSLHSVWYVSYNLQLTWFLLQFCDDSLYLLLIFNFALYSIQVKEHLKIFAILKGVDEELLEIKVDEMVDEVSFWVLYVLVDEQFHL